MLNSISLLEQQLANAKQRISELESVVEELDFNSHILENMSEGINLVRPEDGIIVYTNKIFDQMFGYQPGELIGKHVDVLNAPDTSGNPAEVIASTLRNGNEWHGEIRNTKKDGSTFWCYARVVKFDSSKFGSVYISVHQDITDRKFIERELLVQRDFESSLIDTAQFIILILDVSGNILNINPYMERLTGYSKIEVLGKNWFTTFIPEKDHVDIRDLFASSVKGQKVQGNVNPILAKDGHEVCIEWYDSVLKNDKGNVIALLAIGQDISDKRKTELELQKSNRTLQEIHTAMDHVGLGIHIVDPENGRFIHVNDAACQMLGYTQEEMLSLSVPDIDPNYPKESFKEISSSIRDEPGRVETINCTKDGLLIPVEVSFQFIPGSGNESGYFIAFITDLTERKKMEDERRGLQKQLLQSQKMESIGHLTGGVAHDFNNMLAAILGYTNLINKKFIEYGAMDDKAQEYLDQVTVAANRAKELIAQMLIFSRKSNELVDIPVINLKLIIDEISSLLYSSFPSTISINVNVPDEDIKVSMSPVQLHQVILNLCINARDAIGEYGGITITIEKVHYDDICMSCHQHFTGAYALITVVDTGHGMDEQQVQRIFEPFFTTKDIGKGSGMGLSVIHGIVHAANGHILVSSKIDKGSAFKILLPLESGAESIAQAEDFESDIDNRLADLCIMIVDDEKQIATMMAEIFEMHGAQTRVYSQSIQALQEFEADPDTVDIVFTDETMPLLSGLDMSISMLKIRPDLPIIISTGYSEQVNQKTAREHGIAGFMMKPVNIEKLLQLIVDVT